MKNHLCTLRLAEGCLDKVFLLIRERVYNRPLSVYSGKDV
jgi:hypothetical protein